MDVAAVWQEKQTQRRKTSKPSAIVDNLKEAHHSALLASGISTVKPYNSLHDQLQLSVQLICPLFRALIAGGCLAGSDVAVTSCM